MSVLAAIPETHDFATAQRMRDAAAMASLDTIVSLPFLPERVGNFWCRELCRWLARTHAAVVSGRRNAEDSPAKDTVIHFAIETLALPNQEIVGKHIAAGQAAGQQAHQKRMVARSAPQ
jgi:hypothetical protein